MYKDVYIIVALNYQKQDFYCFLNDAQFSQNGGCGYVLKPEYLTKPIADYSPTCIPRNISTNPKLIMLTIICGQHIPRKRGGKSIVVTGSGNIAEPYVRARILSHPDEKETKQITEVARKNGFNPFWNETFQFFVKAPALSFLELTVKDKHSYKAKLREKTVSDAIVGGFVCPVNLLREGM